MASDKWLRAYKLIVLIVTMWVHASKGCLVSSEVIHSACYIDTQPSEAERKKKKKTRSPAHETV